MLVTKNAQRVIEQDRRTLKIKHSHVDAQCVFLELHKLPDQYAKGFPVISSRWQLFAQLLNYRLKLLEECFSLQGLTNSCTLSQTVSSDRSKYGRAS